MGVLKLTASELQNIKQVPKELSEFWQTYFAKLSVSLSKLFTRYTLDDVSVRYLHRDVIKGSAYFETITQSSVIQPFKVSPVDGIGFLFITNDLSNHLINSILGGRDNELPIGHLITNTDFTLLENIMSDIMLVLLKQIQEDHRNIDFTVVNPKDVLLFTNSNAAEQIISVQQFLVVTNNRSFVFDIAFTNRVLEEFYLI